MSDDLKAEMAQEDADFITFARLRGHDPDNLMCDVHDELFREFMAGRKGSGAVSSDEILQAVPQDTLSA